MKNIIFLFGLPRSGTTLLQKILASDKRIDTFSEPWILLPIIFSLKSKKISTEYDQNIYYNSFKDIVKHNNNDEVIIDKRIKEFIINLYGDLVSNTNNYFLDKTPRYYQIIEEIYKIFPDAKFIYLFRNPLSMLISVRKTWKYAWFSNYISKDLFEGPNALSHAAKNHEESSLVLTYENLISNSERELKKISEYLGINIDRKTLNQFTNTDLRGKRGDKTGSVKYKHVVGRSIETWKIESDNIFTKLYFPYYLNKYCINYCEVADYNPQKIIKTIWSVKFNVLSHFNLGLFLIKNILISIMKSLFSIK